MKMKTGWKGIMLGALLFAGSIAASAGNKIMVLPYQNTSYALVTAEVLNEKVGSLAILDDKGETVYLGRPDIVDGLYSKLFDLSHLTNGRYRLRLFGEAGVLNEVVFEVKNGAVKAAKSELFADYDNDLRVWSNEEYFFVSHLNRTLNPAVITLKDDYGRVVYSEKLPFEFTYSGKYNVASLPRGEYIVNIVSGSKEFSYAFRK